MARGNAYDKSYADRYMRVKKIERVGPLLEQMLFDDICSNWILIFQIPPSKN